MAQSKELIDDYLLKFLEANKSINLTRITDEEQASLLHVEDSLVALPEMEAAPLGLYGDLGSGGGFPGVPLALATGRQTVLIDSVKKKMRAVEGILEQLGISEQITTYDGRIENLSKEKPRAFAVLSARALSSLPALLELASPLLQLNGHLICFKAQMQEDEIAAARYAAGMTGMKLIGQRSLCLSDGSTQRTIMTYEKVSEPKVSLPRRVGMAQKHPLVG